MSQIRLSVAQRKQVIDDYLNGILTLEYKVKQSDDGKYRVSRRSDSEIQKMKEEYSIKDLEKVENDNEEQTEEEDNAETESKPESENAARRDFERSETEGKSESVHKNLERNETEKKSAKPQVRLAPKPAPPKPRGKPVHNEVIESLQQTNQEILNHLRLLGEEKNRKRQKKEVKREVKHRIDKIYKQPNYEDENQDEEEDARERVIIIQRPQYQRRRLNLLND